MLEAHRLRNPQIGRFNIFSGDKKGFVLHPDNLSRVRSGMPGTAVAEAWRRTFTHSALHPEQFKAYFAAPRSRQRRGTM